QVAGELELVAELDLVDQFHGQQEHHDHEGSAHLDERPCMETVIAADRFEKTEEKPDECHEEEQAAKRREPFGEAEEHGAARADEAPQTARITVDLRLVV